MDVILAGFNIDAETLKEMEAGSGPTGEKLTPETVSAAYARISRNPRPVNELRQIAREDLEKARRSNQTIVFDMGHSSIAEHAAFNIDVLRLSRLAVEFVEQFRLASYTEKSQRYIRLNGDFVVPEEIRKAGLADLFTETIQAQNALYEDLHRAILHHLTEREPVEPDRNRAALLDGSAKEDARYILSLATESQLGMTVNARTLELMIRRAAAHPLAEVREYGRRLFDATHDVAPSLIRYTEATDFDRHTGEDLKRTISVLAGSTDPATADDPVLLVDSTRDGDNMILAALIQNVLGQPLPRCLHIARNLALAEKESLIRAACARMESWDAPLREFEMAEMTFDVVMSASCFAQMKRHRMATVLARDYDPALDVTVPETIINAGMEETFRTMIDRTNDTHERIRAHAPEAAPYVLTNAHRRRVVIKVNLRELYHIVRLREDRHAQWDIQQTARRMVDLGRQAMPLSLMFACGKDAFREVKEKQLQKNLQQ